MGQQQLLLIILGVLIIGVAIATGVQLFATGAEATTRDNIHNSIMNIVSDAQAHFFRPNVMGGGNGSFEGYSLPERLSEMGNMYFDTNASRDELVVEGRAIVHNEVIVRLTLTRIEGDWDYDWNWEHEGF